jgi:hypothetical protein
MAELTLNDPKDIEDILAVHQAWLESNNGLVVEKMYGNFASPGYYQFNLNGHTYKSVEEKIALWNGLHEIDFNLADMTIVEAPIVYSDGHLAYLMAVWSARIVGTGTTGLMVPDAEPVVFRVTEVYRKDDGKGNPVWKIWHFHASPIAGPDLPRFPQEATSS